MNSKNKIINAIREQNIDRAEHPSLDQDWIQYENKIQQFSEMVSAVGGTPVPVKSLEEIQSHLDSNPVYQESKIICSLVDGLKESQFHWDNIKKPNDLASVDFAIFPAKFGVAENGAVWVTDENLKERAIYVLPQHLACLISASEIVNNMHEAYERISFTTENGNPKEGYGLFISGPSKTADIEQSLVIGAHGARSLTVYILDK